MPSPLSTLVLSRADIAALARPADYIAAVEAAFRSLAAGTWDSLPVGHVPAATGAFHIKAALGREAESWVVIKINGNYPDNPRQFGLPTIQGCLILADASDGRLLAMMDSIEITAQRTAAASAVAARYLAAASANTLALVGCGTQARYHLSAMLALSEFRFRSLRCFDSDAPQAHALAEQGRSAGLDVVVTSSPGEACRGAQVIVTSTPSREPLLHAHDVEAGAFIAAVGADNPSKCEIAPALMARARVVPDILRQAETLGDLCRAIAENAMRPDQIHGELAQVVSGALPGRRDADELFIFDSTGTAIEDLAAAAMVYRRAQRDGVGLRVPLNG